MWISLGLREGAEDEKRYDITTGVWGDKLSNAAEMVDGVPWPAKSSGWGRNGGRHVRRWRNGGRHVRRWRPGVAMGNTANAEEEMS